MLDTRPVGPDRRPRRARPAQAETLVVAVGEFGRSPQKRRQHLRQRQQRRRPRSLALLLHGLIAGAGIKRGYVHGKSDATASARWTIRCIPAELLATIYHSFGIDPTRSSTTT